MAATACQHISGDLAHIHPAYSYQPVVRWARERDQVDPGRRLRDDDIALLSNRQLEQKISATRHDGVDSYWAYSRCELDVKVAITMMPALLVWTSAS